MKFILKQKMNNSCTSAEGVMLSLVTDDEETIQIFRSPVKRTITEMIRENKGQEYTLVIE